MKILFPFFLLISFTVSAQYAIIDRTGKVHQKLDYDTYSYQSDDKCFPVKKGGMAGYANSKGELVIPLKFDVAARFRGNYAKVKVNDKWGLIDKDGNYVLQPIYRNVGGVANGKAVVSTERLKNYWVNFSGEPLTKRFFKSVGADNDKVYTASVYGKNWGLYSFEGDKDITGEVFTEIRPFGAGLFAAKRNGKIGILDNNGEWIQEPSWSYLVSDDEKKYYFAPLTTSTFQILDEKGQVINTIDKYEAFTDYRHRTIAVKKDGKWGRVDINGRIVVPLKYDANPLFSKKRISGFINKKIGVTDTLGNVIIPFEYDKIYYLRNGTAIFNKGEKTGVIDEKGRVATLSNTRDNFFLVGLMNDKYAFVQRELEKFGVVDLNGKEVLPAIYDRMNEPFNYVTSGGNFWLLKDKKYGLISPEGDIILPFIFSSLVPLEKGETYLVKSDNIGMLTNSQKQGVCKLEKSEDSSHLYDLTFENEESELRQEHFIKYIETEDKLYLYLSPSVDFKVPFPYRNIAKSDKGAVKDIQSQFAESTFFKDSETNYSCSSVKLNPDIDYKYPSKGKLEILISDYSIDNGTLIVNYKFRNASASEITLMRPAKTVRHGFFQNAYVYPQGFYSLNISPQEKICMFPPAQQVPRRDNSPRLLEKMDLLRMKPGAEHSLSLQIKNFKEEICEQGEIEIQIGYDFPERILSRYKSDTVDAADYFEILKTLYKESVESSKIKIKN